MSEDRNLIYGKKLTRLRTNQFLTQNEVASKFSITQQSYADLENGQTNFSFKKIEKICEIFDIVFEDFITLNSDLVKTKNRDAESYTIKLLKKHHEKVLLEKDIRIGELVKENKYLKRDITISKDPPDVYVMI